VATHILADVEYATREWLRVLPSITALVGTRVHFGIPANATFPLIVITRVGGGPDLYLPIDRARLSLSCWGQTKQSAARVAQLVASEIRELDNTAMGADAVGFAGSVASIIWLPDPTSGTPRYVVEAGLSVRPA
jgi:hypothetical protein